MPSAAAIKSRINAVLRKVGPPVFKVYKRMLTVNGSASANLLGRTTKTSVDVLLNPQPMYHEVLQESPVHMQRASNLDGVKTSGGKQVPAGVYEFLMSADTITMDELQSGNIQLVLYDGATPVDVMAVEHYDAGEWQGGYFAFTIYAKSVSRT